MMNSSCTFDGLERPSLFLSAPSTNLCLSGPVIWLFFNFGCYCFVSSNQASNDTDEPDNQQSRKRRDTENKMLVSSKNLNYGVLSIYKIIFRLKKS